MSYDHSEVVPLLPIPNRTVKRLSADDSAGSRVKVGHRQALTAQKSPAPTRLGFFAFEFQNGADGRHRVSDSIVPCPLAIQVASKFVARRRERLVPPAVAGSGCRSDPHRYDTPTPDR